MAYLALRSTSADGAPWYERAFASFHRLRLTTSYVHSGLVAHGKLYHSNAKEGLHVSDFEPEKWEMIPLGPEGDTSMDDLIVSRYLVRVSLGHVKYDYFSLLRFLPVSFFVKLAHKNSKFAEELLVRIYCHEWCWEAITGMRADRKIQVEKLLVLAHRLRTISAA